MTIMEITTAPLSTKEPGGTRGVTTQISMVYIIVAITPPMLMSELERLERVSLLFNENRDENKTSGFLNRHIYGTTMIQYQLKKKTHSSQ